MEGISIIMAVEASELDELDAMLGIRSLWLAELARHHTRDPDTVYRVLLPDTVSMKALSSLLNVKRGILFVDGKVEFIGFNRDWMTKTLRWQEARKASSQTNPPRPMVSEPIWERDDPWEAIGYSR